METSTRRFLTFFAFILLFVVAITAVNTIKNNQNPTAVVVTVTEHLNSKGESSKVIVNGKQSVIFNNPATIEVKEVK